MLKTAVILTVTMASALSCAAAAAQIDPTKAVRGIVERWFPEHRSDFVFVQIPNDPGGDVFEIESKKGRIFIRGNDGVAMASGLNWYLKYHCNVNITYFACQTKLPQELPVIPSKIRQVSPYKYRYIFNYCAFSYSLAWLDWQQWERLIDYMALHGINMPLAVTGQEAVWREVYRKLALKDGQIDEFFTGAAFLPFGWMGCLDGWGGPLPESWYGKRVELQKRILERERSFGMTPVLQGFTGHVPKGIKEVFPEAKLHKTYWNSFDPTYFLDPLDPNFQKIGSMFIEEQTRMFGTDHLYASDTFIEMKPDNNEPEFLAAFGRAIYNGMSSADPEAIWVLQDWFFAADGVLEFKFWKPDQSRALLTSVPQGRLLMLEMGWFWTTTEAFYGQPWVLTYVHNFGGVVSLHGAVDSYGPNIYTALHHPERGNQQGIGTTDEGFDYNPHVIDFMTDSIWRAEKPDMEKWYSDYLRRRYGQQDSAIDEAWKILRKTAFSVWRYDSAICNFYGGDKAGGPGYDNKQLAGALDLYLQAADRLGDTDTYRFDLLNIERQVLANLADNYFNEFRAAVAAKDIGALDATSAKMLGLIDDLDRLTGTRKDYMFGPWLEDAMSWGSTESEKRYYQWNAKNLLTLWGPPQTGCYQYAQRQWSGLLKGYYRKRWEKGFKAHKDAIETGKPVDEQAFMKALREWEDKWGRRNTKFATKPKGDTVDVARELWVKYRADVVGRS
ncbi:MAG: alpha-N-acetylglucosaminidase [Armatimonadota bacterium]|nr:alpha-N-acetylglucosaminidase [Armatimonadota bacterium]